MSMHVKKRSKAKYLCKFRVKFVTAKLSHETETSTTIFLFCALPIRLQKPRQKPRQKLYRIENVCRENTPISLKTQKT